MPTKPHSPVSEEANVTLWVDSEDPFRATTCECGHDLSAHQITQSDPNNPSPCAGCAEQYHHGGCRAGGFQNAETRSERLTYLVSTLESEMHEAKHIQA